MAKKIRLDFSKVEDKGSFNTRHIPEGLHKMKITAVKETEAGDGTDMLVYSMVPTDSRYKSRVFPFYCKLQPNQLWKLRDLLVAAGIKVPTKAAMIDPNGPVGKLIAAEVEDDEYKGNVRSQVQGTYGLDILDGDDSPADDTDDEDEESEDEEYEADDEDDDEGDDDEDEEGDEEEDELREELDALGLPALRKRAKELGIATTGLKKDDLVEAILEEELAEEDDEDEDELDEDDLDDEDLEDEDLEDDEDEEEEEPEPAPRRRAAAKKPAAKAPAKAAPKATAARRTVKRR